ncbi:hypothetical protein [Breoghania sp.]|uniref:hypothetical protein n=1 Tax=Breoghania sp. TaxID=2065378 RepID=UPI002AAA841D|nr:hypothetical protein [Breoghania sp.]
MSAGFSTVLKVLALVVFAAGLASCREEEQGRPLHYVHGEYGGKKDTPLTAQQERALQLRVLKQKN